MIWTEFNQLAAQEATSAREAVAIMGALSEACWLSADPGTSFAVADAHEGWWIEIARGGQWVAERVPDDGAVMHANAFLIDEIDFGDPDNFMWSADVIGYAQERGWYDPASGEPFSWRDAYAQPGSADWAWNAWRTQRIQGWLDGLVPNVTKEDVMAMLRDHFEGTEWDFSRDYQVSPHRTKARGVCRTSTEVAFVTQLRDWMPPEIGAVAWISMKTPCSSAFVPWYMGTTRVPKAYTRGTTSTPRARRGGHSTSSSRRSIATTARRSAPCARAGMRSRRASSHGRRRSRRRRWSCTRATPARPSST